MSQKSSKRSLKILGDSYTCRFLAILMDSLWLGFSDRFGDSLGYFLGGLFCDSTGSFLILWDSSGLFEIFQDKGSGSERKYKAPELHPPPMVSRQS